MTDEQLKEIQERHEKAAAVPMKNWSLFDIVQCEEDRTALLEEVTSLHTQIEHLQAASLEAISALTWLPEDSGPVRRRAGEAIKALRDAIEK